MYMVFSQRILQILNSWLSKLKTPKKCWSCRKVLSIMYSESSFLLQQRTWEPTARTPEHYSLRQKRLYMKFQNLIFGCRFRFFLSYNHHLPPFCASPQKNPPIFVPHPSYAWNGDLANQDSKICWKRKMVLMLMLKQLHLCWNCEARKKKTKHTLRNGRYLGNL